MTIEENLKHFHYHWFWGLQQGSTPKTVNLWTQLQSCCPIEMRLARQKQAEIKQKIWPVRVFYWLFNLSNYSQNYYLLAAQDLILDQEQHGTIMDYYDWLKKEAAKKVSKLKKKYEETSSSAKNYFKTTPQTSSPEAHQKDSENQAAEVGLSSSENKREEREISTWMLPFLKTLGITAVLGQSITFIEIKKNYLQKALATHPDKNKAPNAHQDFIELSIGYKKLEAAFHGNQQEIPAELLRDDLWQTCNELHKTLERIILSYEKRCRTYENMMHDCAIMRQDHVIMKQDHVIMRKQLQKQLEEIEANQRSLDENADLLSEIERRLAEGGWTFDMSVENDEPEVTFSPLELQPDGEEIEPLRPLLRTSFFNTLTIKGLSDNYFTQLRKSSFPFFTSPELRLIQQILEQQPVANSRREPVLMICDRPTC